MRQERRTVRWAVAVGALCCAAATVSTAGDTAKSEPRERQHAPAGRPSAGAGASDPARGAGRAPAPNSEVRARTYTRYLAEGSTSSFFNTQIALLNPGPVDTTASIELMRDGLPVATHAMLVPARTRRTFVPSTLPGFRNAAFAIKVTSDQLLVVDRTMYWNESGYGAHAESAVAAASSLWYFAEGSTNAGLDVFYLLQNPASTPTTVRMKYLRSNDAPLVKEYVLPAQSRTNIWVNQEEFPAGSGNRLLSSSEFGAVVESLDGTPIIAERAMYLSRRGRPFDAGHASMGVTAPQTRWFLAEGATGRWFDMFVLIANPTDRAAEVLVTYLLDGGRTLQRRLTAPANSRSGISVDREEIDGVDGFPLENVAVSTTVESTNGVPIVVERTMWWPGGPDGWREAHNSAGATETGTLWALAEGEVGGPRNLETYVLIANTSTWNGQARVTLLFEDGTSVSRVYALAARSRANAAIANDFGDAAASRRFGVLVESVGSRPAEVVVERAMYSSAGAEVWAAGTNVVGTRLPTQTETVATNPASPLPTAQPTVDGQAVPVPRAVTPSATTSLINRYRLYSPITLEHLFTTDRNEYDTLTPTLAWQGENVATRIYNGPATVGGVAAVPYYRVYDKITRWHHWTTDLNEYETLGRITARYNQEGIDGYLFKTQVPGTVPWYRLLFTAIAGLHHWTADQAERDALVNSGGWVEEAKEYVYLPDPTNLAPSCEPGCDETVEGIDANLNSVRDDVERYIEQSGASEAEQVAMTDAAVALQEALAPAPTEGEAVDRANEVMRTIDCVRSVDESGARASDVVAETLDTFGRSERYIALNNAVAGQVFPTGDNADLSSCSSAVVQALPADRRAALLLKDTTGQCRATSTSATLLYLGGVTTTLDVARESHRLALERLKSALSAGEQAQLDGGDVLLVGNGRFVSDLLATAQQQGMGARDFWRTLRGTAQAPQWFQNRFVELASGSAIAANLQTSHLARVQDKMRSGNRVIIVAHSQGNLFANKLVDSLTTTEQRSARIVSVANPDTRVAGGGSYTTLSEDLVVNAVRALRPATLPANVTNQVSNLIESNGWHDFRAYMTGPRSGEQVVSHMVSAFRGLVRPTQTVGSGVITVTMTWGSQPDVDLHVTEPNGTHVYYGFTRGPSGYLDVDDVDGSGPEHYYVACATLEAGTYAIGVNYYFGSGAETATVQVEAGGETVRTFRVPLPAARGFDGDSSPIPVASIVVTRDARTGAYSYVIR